MSVRGERGPRSRRNPRRHLNAVRHATLRAAGHGTGVATGRRTSAIGRSATLPPAPGGEFDRFLTDRVIHRWRPEIPRDFPHHQVRSLRGPDSAGGRPSPVISPARDKWSVDSGPVSLPIMPVSEKCPEPPSYRIAPSASRSRRQPVYGIRSTTEASADTRNPSRTSGTCGQSALRRSNTGMNSAGLRAIRPRQPCSAIQSGR